MAIRGERFELNLDSDDETPQYTGPLLGSEDAHSLSFVKDIVERDSAEAAPPTVPKLKSTPTGFPEHRKRSSFTRAKQQAVNEASTESKNPPSSTLATSQAANNGTSRNGFSGQDMQRIDEENKQKLQDMSEDEIAQERKELLSGLSGSLIERLLKRGNMDEGRLDTLEPSMEPPSTKDAASDKSLRA
ncbi:MAG: hypothetical protein LQ340_007223, partial [Diploschistes diacapsis]